MAVAATGTLLKIGDAGGPESFTTIAEVKDISGPAITVNTVETTSHDASGWTTFIPTLKTAGEITFDINFTAAATQGFSTGLYNDAMNRTRRNFQIVLPTSPTKTGSFAAYVTGFELSEPVDDVLSASITLTVDGAVTWA